MSIHRRRSYSLGEDCDNNDKENVSTSPPITINLLKKPINDQIIISGAEKRAEDDRCVGKDFGTEMAEDNSDVFITESELNGDPLNIEAKDRHVNSQVRKSGHDMEKEKTLIMKCANNASMSNSQNVTEEIKNNDEHFSSILEEAPVSETLDKNLCSYACPDCQKTFTCWLAARGHMKIIHGKVQKLADYSVFMVRTVVHVCKICSQKVICDSTFLNRHMRKHRMSLPEYKMQYACESVSKIKQLKLLEEGTISKGKIGNLCRFACPRCKKTTKSLSVLRRWHSDHQLKCSFPIKYNTWEEFAIKVVTHQCGICSKIILCEKDFILMHARLHKIKSVNEYVEKTGSVMKPSMRKRRETIQEIEKCEVLKSVDSNHKNTSEKSKSHKSKEVSPLVKSPGITSEVSINSQDESDKSHHMSNILEEAPVSETLDKDLCSFSCTECQETLSTWQGIKCHMKATHQIIPKNSEHLRYMLKIVVHICKICSEKVICESTFLNHHVRKHNMSLQEYKLQFACESVSRTKQFKLLEEGKSSNDQIGNMCEFTCPHCEMINNSFATLRSQHRTKRTNCPFKIRYKSWEECATSVTTHSCGICSKLLPCDMEFIKEHIRQHKIKSVNEYLKKTGCVRELRMSERKQEENNRPCSSSDNIWSFLDSLPISETLNHDSCTYMCSECNHSCTYWEELKIHMKTQHMKAITISEITEFFLSATSHVCRICSRKLLCERQFLKQHLRKHNMSLSEYKLQFDCYSQSKIKKEKLLEEGTLSKGEIGNLCQFTCPQCNATSNSFETMRRKHEGKKVECSFKINSKNWEEFATKVVTHNCGICDKLLPCDSKIIMWHVAKHDIKSIKVYAEKTGNYLVSEAKSGNTSGCKKMGKGTLEDLEKNAKTLESVGNFCKYTCEMCGHSEKGWLAMNNHLKENNHWSPSGKEWCRYITKYVLHQCKICETKLANDKFILAYHTKKSHQMSLPEYATKFGIENN